MRLALYHPDMPQNTGTILRLGACFGMPVDIIEPCGFLLDDRRLHRAAMDYIHHVDYTRHESWDAFKENRPSGRLVLLTTRGQTVYTEWRYKPDDILLLGSESAGVPDDVRRDVDGAVRVPMRLGLRSLNVAMAAALVVGEAARQTGIFDMIERPRI